MDVEDSLGLHEVAASARERLEAKNAARERALSTSRSVVRECANAIRSAHRGEYDAAAAALGGVAARLTELGRELGPHPDVLWAGYVQDAHKEYAEARITLALVRHESPPSFEELGVGVAPYLNGLGEAVGELGRSALDIIRHGEAEEA